MKAVIVLFRYRKAPVISHQSLLFSSLDESVFLSLSLQSKCYSPWNHLAGLMLNLFQLCARSLSSGNLVKISTTQNVLLCPARWVDYTNLSSDDHHLSKGTPVFSQLLNFCTHIVGPASDQTPHWCILWEKTSGLFSANALQVLSAHLPGPLLNKCYLPFADEETGGR